MTPDQDYWLTILVVATHLVLTLTQLMALLFILIRDCKQQSIHDQHRRQMFTQQQLQMQDVSLTITDRERYQMELTSLSTHTDKEARDAWLSDFIYILIVILYYFAYDMYRLTDPRTFIRPQDADNKFDPTILIILYLGGYAIRMEDKFPTFPTLGSLVFGWIERKTEFNVYNWKSKAYIASFTLRVLINVFILLISASTYIFADYDYCTNYFVCIYSWDHWFQIPLILGWAWVLHGSCLKNMIRMTLILICFGLGMLPFFTLPIIIPLTLLLSLLYGWIHTSVALYLLSNHQTKSL
jgi:hypothetical protein